MAGPKSLKSRRWRDGRVADCVSTDFGHQVAMQPMTDYFRNDVLIKRPYIRIEWCESSAGRRYYPA